MHVLLYGFHNGAGETSHKHERENADENQVNNSKMDIQLEYKHL